MKNAAYFSLKTLFVVKVFEFSSSLFGHIEKRLDKKAKVIFKNCDVINWETNYYKIHILLNISRSKGNQTMEFGQLIGYNMRNNFLEQPLAKLWLRK